MYKKTFIVILLITFTFSLHLQENNNLGIHHEQIQNITNSTNYLSNNNIDQVKSLINSINNKFINLQATYKLIQNSPDSSMIQNLQQIIKCKNISQKSQANIQSEIQYINTDIWQVYFKIQQFIQKGIQLSEKVKKFQDLKDRLKIIKNKQIIYCVKHSQNQIKNTQSNILQLTLNADISKNKFISNLNGNNNWVWGTLSESQYKMKQYQLLLSNDIILCPNDKPFFNTNICISCSKGQIYFLDKNQCKICPTNTTFNQVQHSCLSNQVKECPANQIYSIKTNLCQCPLNKPYFNGYLCQECFVPYFWNKETKKCQSCGRGKFYDPNSSKCLQCKSITAFKSQQNLLLGCHQQCTLLNPFYNGEKCISCPNIFNKITNQCQLCPKQLKFNDQKNICENIKIDNRPICKQGEIFNEVKAVCQSISQQKCPSAYIYNSISGKCQCPSYSPYDNGIKCISCIPQLWNKEKKQCISCKGQSYYDQKAQKCISCPSQTPLALNNKCVSCPSNSVFDPKSQICLTFQEHYCPPYFVWNQKQKKCSCPLGQKWSDMLNTCVFEGNNITNTINLCKQAEIWDQKSQKCICIPDRPYQTNQGCVKCYDPLIWSNITKKCEYQSILNNISSACPSNLIFSRKTNKCECPQDKPFFNLKSCEACYLPMYWNVAQKKCKYCSTNQYFNTFKRSCETCPINKPILINYECSLCPIGTYFNKNSLNCDKIICSNDSVFSKQKNNCICKDQKKPFYNGSICVQCLPPNRWDIALRSCVKN